MLRTFMRAKLHRATVTGANQAYMGSVTLDPKLLRAAGILPFEQVDVLNVSNGNRVTTYAIEGKPGKGQVVLNGAAALLFAPGDIVLVVAYAQLEPSEIASHKATTVFVDAKNRVKKILRRSTALRGRPTLPLR